MKQLSTEYQAGMKGLELNKAESMYGETTRQKDRLYDEIMNLNRFTQPTN
jgi:hypothetical protein